MFTPGTKMQTPATPERVYTLCRIIEKQPMALKELRERMEPDYLQNKTSYFSDYRNAAQELELIAVSDNVASLCVDPREIASLEAMRRCVNGRLEHYRGGKFYEVTREYFRRGDDILTQGNSVVEMAGSLSASIGMAVDGMEMRAWRFWAPFLGFGQMQDMLLLPNAATFLRDVILHSDLERRQYSFGEFIRALSPYCGIVFDEELANHRLNFGVSNGLRTLHDMKVIRLEHILDQHDIWSLYPMQSHQIRTTVTNVTIL